MFAVMHFCSSYYVPDIAWNKGIQILKQINNKHQMVKIWLKNSLKFIAPCLKNL